MQRGLGLDGRDGHEEPVSHPRPRWAASSFAGQEDDLDTGILGVRVHPRKPPPVGAPPRDSTVSAVDDWLARAGGGH